ncbi:hypothetical protein ACQJBY_033095 [Aegilops geniculata]
MVPLASSMAAEKMGHQFAPLSSWPICTSINEVAAEAVRRRAKLNLEDTKGRIPIDLLSAPVSQANGDSPNSVGTEVFSWGSGSNYQLGTGNAHIQKVFY